jgi:hypothetical protein
MPADRIGIERCLARRHDVRRCAGSRAIPGLEEAARTLYFNVRAVQLLERALGKTCTTSFAIIGSTKGSGGIKHAAARPWEHIPPDPPDPVPLSGPGRRGDLHFEP